MLRYRGIVDLDGNTNSWRGAYWKLRSNSVVLKQQSPFCQWYYHRLVPYVHYIPLTRDLGDVNKWEAWVAEDAHIPTMRAIARASTELMRTLTLSSAIAQLRYDIVRGELRPVTQTTVAHMRQDMEQVITMIEGGSELSVAVDPGAFHQLTNVFETRRAAETVF